MTKLLILTAEAKLAANAAAVVKEVKKVATPAVRSVYMMRAAGSFIWDAWR